MSAAKRQSSRNPLPFLIAVIVIGAILYGLWLSGRKRPAPAPIDLQPAPTETPQPARPAAQPDTVVLAPTVRAIPGAVPTDRIRFRQPTARGVKIAGSWNYWGEQTAMVRKDGLWEFDVASRQLAAGRYEFKFVVDGVFEPGDNRVLYINLDGLVERPQDLIFSARLEAPDRIDVHFRHDVTRTDAVRARLIPDVPIARVNWQPARGAYRAAGFSVAGEFVTFYLDESVYDVALNPKDKVTVAGSFNGWRSDGAGGQWQLHDEDDDNLWSVALRLDGLTAPPAGADAPTFKFVVNDNRWLPVPGTAPNAVPDGEGNLNHQLDSRLSAAMVLEVHTERPLPLSEHFNLVLEGLTERSVFREVTPGAVLDQIVSRRALGAEWDPATGATTFRLFAPRASVVEVLLYDGPYSKKNGVGPDPVAPRTVLQMKSNPDGVWDVTAPGVDPGQYYVFRVDGPAGAGEGFNPQAKLGDPYALALAHGDNNALVVDASATNAWFKGWTDAGHKIPPAQDIVIYETHVRDLTRDPSAGVADKWRGTYAGLLETLKSDAGLSHLKKLGVNVIELMPTAEFSNGMGRYDWGYGPAFYFAPEASYGTEPLRGSQFYEFKHMVNELHAQGFSVILDVVYNHIGSPNVFHDLDSKYYFRQDQDYKLSNFSGCGNDVRTEAPMMRRLIVDNILYWMREHHVDGFRFDLADLIDMDTLMAVRDAARAENPDVILISEPWSFRGDHRTKLKGKQWAAWNGEFRRVAHRFVRGEGNRDDLRTQIRGCVDTWAATPLQCVNYLESHDDKALADEITTQPQGDGRKVAALDAARNRLAATLLFTSLGIPMLSEGQEWLRSKHGLHNTYDKGDEVNALRWDDRRRPEVAETLAYYRDLIRLRRGTAGACFRWSEAVPDDYFEWITPPDGRALGYVINGQRRYPGGGFVVLLNAADKPMSFSLRFPSGDWRLIGDGHKLDSHGITGTPPLENPDGTRTVTVPAVSAYVYGCM